MEVLSRIEWSPRFKGVLVVEDDPHFRDLVCKCLNDKFGRFSIGVEDGLQALDFLQCNASRLDAVISDISIPKLDGINLLEMVRTMPNMSHLKVALMTQHREKAYRLRAEKLGAHFIDKQDGLHDLLAAIQAFLVSQPLPVLSGDLDVV